jgi:hypothetical protein
MSHNLGRVASLSKYRSHPVLRLRSPLTHMAKHGAYIVRIAHNETKEYPKMTFVYTVQQ